LNVLKYLKKLHPKNSFARGVSALVGGTVGAQALMMLAAPLLTRLYTPEDFGLLAIYSGLLALFTVVASLRYELAIPLSESNTEAANIVALSLLVAVLMAAISALMVFVAGEKIAHSLGTPELSSYLWLLPLGVLLSGFCNVFNYWAVRTQHFGDISRTRIKQTLAILAIQLFGYKLGSIALLLGQAGGQGVGSLILARSALKSKAFSSWSWSGVSVVLKRYKQFPKFSIWTGLFNTAGTQIPTILIANFFTSGAAGLFALANRVLLMPMNIFGGAIGSVFFSNAASAYRLGILNDLVVDTHEKLAKIAMPFTLVLALFSPLIFSFLFGDEWRVAGEMAQWMAPWLYLQFVSSPLSSVFAVLNSEHKTMLFQGALLMSRLMSLVYGGLYFDPVKTVALYSVVSVIFYFFYLIWIFKCAGLGFLGIFYLNIKLLLVLAPAFFSLYSITIFDWDDVYVFIVIFLFFSYIIIYYLFLFRDFNSDRS
jgi:O-antigen/teichoic acid export membrane protein